MTGPIVRDQYDEQDHSGFWVNPDECVHCGTCRSEAPDMFVWRNAHAADRTAKVARQPATQVEISNTANAALNCCLDCIYYGGKDPKIISQLRGLGVAAECIIND